MASDKVKRPGPASAAYGLTFPARDDGPVAIVGATVIPMDSERVVENQTVVIESGRIRSMGPTPQIDV
ncbi:MAG: hypothetical protein ABIS18_07450, partial [Actinomycetota bacterium]